MSVKMTSSNKFVKLRRNLNERDDHVQDTVMLTMVAVVTAFGGLFYSAIVTFIHRS